MEHKKYLTLALTFVCVLDCVYSAGIIVPCKKGDLECYTKSANLVAPQILAGIPELGVESSDPLHMDFIPSKDNRLEYNYTDVTLNGVKNCKVKDVQFSLESNTLSFGAYCKVDMHGDYVMLGNLLILRVEGNGKFNIDAEKIFIDMTAELKTVKGDDGKDHVNIKNFQIKVEALEKVTFDYTNIFNGKSPDLAKTVLEFANNSYKEVFHETATPIFYHIIKRILKNVNKYLKTVPIDDLFL